MSLPIGKSSVVAWAAVLALAVVICVALFGRRSEPRKEEARGSATQPATHPESAPVSKPAKPPEPKYVATYMDLVHEEVPAFPVTQSLAVPLDLSEAARLLIRDPLYLDAPGSLLWITRPDAPPTDTLLKKPPDDPERVVVSRERVLSVHWLPDGNVVFWPFLIVPAAGDSLGGNANGYDLVSHFGRRKIGSRQDYRWGRALSWNEKLVVPTATGVSVFRFELNVDGRPIIGPDGPAPIEEYQDLTNPAATRPSESTAPSTDFAEPQILLDWQGVLAFIPWDPGKQGGHGAARFVNDKWATLGPATGWPEYVLHLIPLLDGSVMQLVPTRPGEDESDDKAALAASKTGSDPHAWPVKLGVVDLDHAVIDAKKVRLLVAKLGDDDQAVRDTAFNDLTRYGPAVWPILKALYEDAAPEAQARMKQLLRNQAAPLLGGMSLLGSDVRLVCRNPDGSAVFYSEKGVETADADGNPVVTAPAWLAVRPGNSVALLPPILVADLKPETARITPVIDEWIVTSDVRGPRRFIGNGFVNLLKKDETGFTELIGEDRRGRWLFRRPTAAARTGRAAVSAVAGAIAAGATPIENPTTAPESAALRSAEKQPVARSQQSPEANDGVETLIIDPTLPNIVPRLPVWNYATADEVGWDRDNWPAVRQLGNVSRLTEAGWDVLTPDNVLRTHAEQAPALPGPPATGPAGTLPVFTTPQTFPAQPEANSQPATRAASVAATDVAERGVATHEISPRSLPVTFPATTSSAASETATAPATEPTEQPLWVDHDDTRYFNGIDELRVVSPAGRVTSWTLPAVATGKEPVHLVKTDDGRLFLFNEPGRVLRLKPTPGGPDPFVIEATFTRNIPNTDRPTRVWLDPAGRIVVAYDKNLSILFPAGYVPPAIRKLMSSVDDRDSDMDRP